MYEITDLEPKYTVQSLVRALNLLNVISEDSSQDGMALTELAKIVGMSKGSVFSSLQTLAAYGIVSDHGSGHGRRYRLGLGLIRLGNRAAAQITIAEVARPHLEVLSAETGLTSRLAMIQGNWAVAVARVNAPGAIQLNLGLGEREWPHRSALGKALLMGSSDGSIADILGHTGMASQTRHTIATLQDFLANIERSRARGYTLDDEEDRDGIMCVAVPVQNQAGDTIAAMGVTGLKAGPELRDLSAVAKTLATRSKALSMELSASQ
jgi:IclR family acetate operon transcriptional repressor